MAIRVPDTTAAVKRRNSDAEGRQTISAASSGRSPIHREPEHTHSRSRDGRASLFGEGSATGATPGVSGGRSTDRRIWRHQRRRCYVGRGVFMSGGGATCPHSLERHFGAAQTVRCESASVIRVRLKAIEARAASFAVHSDLASRFSDASAACCARGRARSGRVSVMSPPRMVREPPSCREPAASERDRHIGRRLRQSFVDQHLRQPGRSRCGVPGVEDPVEGCRLGS